jgi:hypothetical protein
MGKSKWSSTGRNRLAAARQVCMDSRAKCHLACHLACHLVHLPTITPLRYSIILSSHTRNATTHVYRRASIAAKAGFRILGSANELWLGSVHQRTDGERLLV